MSPRRLFVVDAMAMAFRNFHAFSQRPISTSQGLPTSAIFGCAQFLMRLMEHEKPDYLVIASDSREPTFRHTLYTDYKANRSEMPAELVTQLPYLFELFEALGLKLLRQAGLEADDLIASLIAQNRADDLHCYIVSGDKDFMQLIDSRTFLYVPQKGGTSKILDSQGVYEKFLCRPEQVVDILALIGDASDNVPGVKGIGEKGASKILAEFGSIENLYQNLDKIKNDKLRINLHDQKSQAELSKQLVQLKLDCALGNDLADFKMDLEASLESPKLLEFFKKLEFRSLVERLSARSNNSFQLQQETKPAAPEVPKQMVMDNPNYLLVNSLECLEKLREKFIDVSAFAFDTETTGLNVALDRPIGVSLAFSEDHAYYLPLVEKHLDGVPAETMLAFIKDILAREGVKKSGHNMKFDLQMLANIGVEVKGPFSDSMIASHLIDPTSKSHGLDACALKYFNFEKIPTSELIGKKGEISMLDVPLDKLSYYACEDADYTFRLEKLLVGKLAEQNLREVFETLEMPLVSVLAKMERRGVFVDTDILGQISISLHEMSQKLEGQIFEHAGEVFNINSTKQLQTILYDKLKIPEKLGIRSLKKTKSGYSTDVSMLERLAEHPIANALLEYRTVTKLKNTYVDALPELINDDTHRVHTSFHQTGTSTGRLSSSQPNLQNIPIRSSLGRDIRRAFRSVKDDHVILSADYSQIELRLLAHLADEKALQEAFKQGEDIHASTAAKVFSCEISEVTKDMRNQAKAINFGIIYGMGPNRLARQTGVSLQEAKEFIAKYFSTYPGIRTYIDKSIQLARDRGFTETISGRRRPLKEINDRNSMLRAAAENIAVNSPIQGSAADLIKLAMVNIENQFEKRGFQSKMLLQVHDELVFECPLAEVEMVKEVIKNEMASALPLEVPLEISVGYGANWLEAH